MGLFSSKNNEGGLMDVIRCDEKEYLIWKWKPSGEVNSTIKENSIRYGSSLRVKDGEMAVLFYKQNNGTSQDFITGPFDGFIKTDNYSFHKNHAANLINICSSCHDKIHHNNVKLTVKKTSEGYELQL